MSKIKIAIAGVGKCVKYLIISSGKDIRFQPKNDLVQPLPDCSPSQSTT